METILKYLGAAACGLLAYLEPTLPFMGVCTVAVLYDVVSAWRLARRASTAQPDKASGKFKSSAMGKVTVTLAKVYGLILLAYLVENVVFEGMNMRLPNIAAGAVCFWQLCSILENEASCNNSKWARIARRILIDKTARHFDIDLAEMHTEGAEGTKDAETNHGTH